MAEPIIQRKITQLPALPAFTGAEYFLIGYNGRSFRVSMDQLVKHFTGNIDMAAVVKLQEVLAEMSDMTNVVTKSQLDEALESLKLPTDQVNALIDAAIAKLPAGPDLTKLATKEELHAALEALPKIDLTAYATLSQVDAKIAAAQLGGTDTEVDLTVFATKEDVSTAIAAIVIPEPQDLSAYAKTADLPAAPDLTPYVKTEDLPAAPDLTPYALKEDIPGPMDLTALASKEELRTAIESIPEVDLSKYVKTADLPAAPDLTDYVKTADLPAQPSLEAYAKLTDVDEKITAAQLAGGDVDLSNYATKNEVSTAIAAIVIPEPQDLTPYAKTADLPAAPDLSGFALKAEIPAAPDLTPYAKTADLPAAPDLTPYAKTADLPVVPDVTNLVTQDQLIEAMPDMSAVALKTDIATAVASAIGASNDIVRVADIHPSRILWVSSNPSSKRTGSILSPFTSISEALAKTASGEGAWAILCMPSFTNSYFGDIDLTDKGNILIQGFGGGTVSNAVKINGTVTLAGNTVGGITIRDMTIEADGDRSSIIADGSNGNHIFHNVATTSNTARSAPAVAFRNGASGTYTFEGCDIEGRFVVEDTTTGDLNINITGQRNATCFVEMEGESRVSIENGRIGSVIHHNGDLLIKYVGKFTGRSGKAVSSTAGARVTLKFLDLQLPNGSYLALEGLDTAKKFSVDTGV